MKTDEIRTKYLEFFKSKSHKVVPSDSLVPVGDPSVLFTSAGMNQFKEQFMGNVGSFRRATTCQKCLRTGDLENVGRTPFHHTLFEMLGNFSFGDYFKKEAIQWAWEFMTEVMKIEKDKLWVSVYKDDEEALNIWKNDIKLPENRIVKLGAKSNFWPANAPEEGPNGPCGPCSEIFYDRGSNQGCGKSDCSPACDCGRFVEVWNLVFTQFNRKGKNDLEPLPNKNIDTGMGLERIASVMQGVATNFEIDIFKPIVEMIEKEISKNAQNVKIEKKYVYAIADHIRAATFAIAEGILPSNEERGYVIRKLIRKSVWYATSMGAQKTFLYKIVSSVVSAMKFAYPDLEERREETAQIMKYEEEKFLNTLESGKRMVSEILEKEKAITSENAFRLYDTFGFPLELTLEIAARANVRVDVEGFSKLMEAQRELSLKASAMEKDIFAGAIIDQKIKELKEKQKFVGYDTFNIQTDILLFKELKQDDKNIFEIVLKDNPFYGEGGGQAGDKGFIYNDKAKFEVFNTKNHNGLIVCLAEGPKGKELSGKVNAEVDGERREAIMCNHTATHLLQAALREVLGKHVKQSGSSVDDKRLRFDFAHFKAISSVELSKIEDLVNEYIKKDLLVDKKEMELTEAKQKGALAFFGDKYGEKVRVVSIAGVSQELCGGTHLNSTKTIGQFRILSESSIASGIRRIEAVTGKEAKRLEEEQVESMKVLCREFNTTPEKLMQKAEDLLNQVKSLEKKIKSLSFGSVKINEDELLKEAFDVKGVKLLIKDFGMIDKKTQQNFSDMLKNKGIPSVTFTAASDSDGFLSFTCSVSKEIVDKGLDASNILKRVLSEFGGSGGGRKDFAQGGIRQQVQIDKVLVRAKEILKGEIK